MPKFQYSKRPKTAQYTLLFPLIHFDLRHKDLFVLRVKRPYILSDPGRPAFKYPFLDLIQASAKDDDFSLRGVDAEAALHLEYDLHDEGIGEHMPIAVLQDESQLLSLFSHDLQPNRRKLLNWWRRGVLIGARKIRVDAGEEVELINLAQIPGYRPGV